jgi:hypothetical protein
VLSSPVVRASFVQESLDLKDHSSLERAGVDMMLEFVRSGLEACFNLFSVSSDRLKFMFKLKPVPEWNREWMP